MDARDGELIGSFARQGSHEVFAALVQRHVDLVYSAARRQLRSQHQAEEVTQLAFVALAQHAPKLPPGASVAPWLIGVTRRLCVDVLKREGRRPLHEQPAVAARAANASAEWARLAPVLDETLAALDQADSTSLLLRYFETKDLRAVGAALGVTDVAAQKRISHALDMLRDGLRRRGIEISSGDLAAHLSAYAVEVAPATLVQTVTAGGLAGAAAGAKLPVAAVGLSAWERTAVLTAIVLGAGGLAFEALALGRVHATVVRLRNENGDLVAQARTAEEQRHTAAAMAAEAAARAAATPATAPASAAKAPASTQPTKR